MQMDRARRSPPSGPGSGGRKATVADIVFGTLLGLTGIGIIAYWVDYWLTGEVHVVKEDWYLRFQNSFAVADGWAAACCLLGSLGLVSARRYGAFFSILAGGSLIFLALMDITFNVQNRLYDLTLMSGPMAVEVFINAWTLSFGGVLVVRSYAAAGG